MSSFQLAVTSNPLMPDFPITSRNRVRRLPKRGVYARKTVYAIIDEALVCHVAFATDGVPTVIPTLHARRGDELLLHGARTSRMLQHVAAGNPIAVAITLLDGIVLARSVFHHSMNYRSVVLHGTGRLLESNEEKMSALEAFAEHIARGRWADARQPSRKAIPPNGVTKPKPLTALNHFTVPRISWIGPGASAALLYSTICKSSPRTHGSLKKKLTFFILLDQNSFSATAFGEG